MLPGFVKVTSTPTAFGRGTRTGSSSWVVLGAIGKEQGVSHLILSLSGKSSFYLTVSSLQDLVERSCLVQLPCLLILTEW